MQPAPATKSRAPRAEQIILFRISGQLFAISSASVQEVRSVDGLTGTPSQKCAIPFVAAIRHITLSAVLRTLAFLPPERD